jgi:acyl transferase domain-containing protein
MGGFVNDIDMFDPLEFGISMKEAQCLDPSLRLTLEAAHQVIR